jgi:hypothetical protein
VSEIKINAVSPQEEFALNKKETKSDKENPVYKIGFVVNDVGWFF